jgi:hypothetical protein
MHLSDFDLKQIDDNKIEQLSLEQLRHLSSRMLHDLKDARDRLNQTPDNSSRPPSSMAPWGKAEANPGPETLSELLDTAPESDTEQDSQAIFSSTDKDTVTSSGKSDSLDKPQGRKAGKQPGDPGYGRTQRFAIDQIESHHPERCRVCDAALSKDVNSFCYSGWDCIDLAPRRDAQPCLRLMSTRHHLYETQCVCGHSNRAMPHRAATDPLWEKVDLGEWRLIGPDLAAVIVFLALRMRLSRARIQEWFDELFDLHLSLGVLDETLREAGRASAGLEDALVHEIMKSPLVHVDETPWKERGQWLWLWVFVSSHTVVYFIGHRTAEMLDNVLTAEFNGQMMSDGYSVYRHLGRRLRCWAHLLRKLKGLAESCDARVADAGQSMLTKLRHLIDGIYRQRAILQKEALTSDYATELALLRALCETHQNDSHDKLRGIAREFLHDWDVIFRQVYDPDLPLTNNVAEQALRHWVISRRISQGTRSESGSRAVAMLASVIDTCRLRGTSCWRYIGYVIRAARQGLPLPALPSIPISAGV